MHNDSMTVCATHLQ